MNKTILITGCSSGIGEHCALALKAKGWRVFATARKAKDIARLKRQGLETFYLDYTEPKSIQKLVKDVSKACDGKLHFFVLLALLFDNLLDRRNLLIHFLQPSLVFFNQGFELLDRQLQLVLRFHAAPQLLSHTSP